MFFLEVALGQYTSEGGITCWAKLCPIFTGQSWTLVQIFQTSAPKVMSAVAVACFTPRPRFSHGSAPPLRTLTGTEENQKDERKLFIFL